MHFQKTVKRKDMVKLSTLLHFPLPTGLDASDLAGGRPVDFISRKEFERYSRTIFHSDAIRLISLAKLGDVLLVDQSNGSYYAALQQVVDKNTPMYELYLQYPQAGSGAESYFGLVFGQISGNFKLIGYYAKWPLK